MIVETDTLYIPKKQEEVNQLFKETFVELPEPNSAQLHLFYLK